MKNDMKTSLERRLEIANLVGLNGKMHVDQLAETFNVTGATIRADLRFLEQNNYIIRSHGYALVNKVAFAKLASNKGAEENNGYSIVDFMGNAISNFIQPNDSIFIHSNKFIRQALETIQDFKNTTVLSNDLRLVNKFINVDTAKFFMTGGCLGSEMKFIGTQMINNLRQHRFNTSFIFIDGFNSKLGIFSKSENDAELIKILCEISERIVVVSDSACFSSNSPFWVCETNSIDAVITEGQIPQEVIDAMELNNVKIIKQ